MRLTVIPYIDGTYDRRLSCVFHLYFHTMMVCMICVSHVLLHSHGICLSINAYYPYTPIHPRSPFAIEPLINMAKSAPCPYCLCMFLSENLYRHTHQCSVRKAMASNNIFPAKTPTAPQPNRNDTAISFEINQVAAASKLGMKSHNVSANDAFNSMSEHGMYCRFLHMDSYFYFTSSHT